jgi:uncharacterized protein YdcH (DUF465 family)
MVRAFRLRLLSAVLGVVGWAGVSPAAPVPAEKSQPVDLVLCIDTSNSMDGLIASAKIKLWDIVNELAKVKPTPELRVGLYSYGNQGHDPNAGWVKKELDLTSDLDAVYAALNALKTRGGNEFVARVSRDAIKQQKWSPAKNALKLVFVCGNEAVNQDREVSLEDVAKLAKEQGIIINTIYCGDVNDGIGPGWSTFAAQCGGKFASINQDKAASEPVIATPFDKELTELSGKLNKTYVFFGEQRKLLAENQLAQDKNAAAAAPGAAAERAAAKAGALYRNSYDLIDRLKADEKFDIKKVKEEELPEELKKLKPEEREAHVKKLAEEREALQKKIQELSAQRSKHIEAEIKKLPKTDKDKALDDALRGIIREQAEGKGFKVEGKK